VDWNLGGMGRSEYLMMVHIMRHDGKKMGRRTKEVCRRGKVSQDSLA
jgi:hypothetical protein